MKTSILAVLVVLMFCGPAAAGKYDLEFPSDLANSVLGDLVKEAGLAAAYRGIAPAEPGGITGFDVAAEVSFINIDNDLWDEVIRLGNGSAPGYLAVPRIHARKGLPFNIDVGASYAQVLDSNVELAGAELQVALLEGTVATPALSLRGSYSTLLGVDDLSLDTYAADAVISKGVLMLTPYAGIGVVHIAGKYDGDDPLLRGVLGDHDYNEVRVFGGVQVALTLLRFTFDVEYSQLPVYTAKISLGF
ncbi:hypothetical protein [Desulfuromonas sp.]|uniref:hypothetical protein n=1 Tax=Desulfuromonas sp. TaxID=892 RepID=UPI0025BB020D|nr:hypothetical protein [Desulfuromonas sp.]